MVGDEFPATEVWTYNGGEPGPTTMKVREALLGIQQGTTPDPHGWMVPVA